MRRCADAHEEIIYDDDPGGPCPLCAANRLLARALAEVSRLEGRVEELEGYLAKAEAYSKGDPA